MIPITYLPYRSASFASREDILRIGHTFDIQYGKPVGGPVMMSDGCTVTVYPHNLHTLVYGSTNAKKTRNFNMPTMYMHAAAHNSMIVYDPKGELYRFIKGKLDIEKYDIHVVNLKNPGTGCRFNILSEVYDMYRSGSRDKAIEMLKTVSFPIFKRLDRDKTDPYWVECANSLFTGLAVILLHIAPKEAFTLKSINDLALGLSGSSDVLGSSLETYFEMFGKHCLAYQMLRPIIENAEKTRSCILSTFSQGLYPYISGEDLCDSMSMSDFDFKGIADKPTCVFITTPDENSTYNAYISTLISLSYTRLIDYADNHCPDGRLPRPVCYILDEFANIPQIIDLPHMLSAARSRNISFTMIVQNSSQLRHIYGDAMLETIEGNIDMLLYLHSRDLVLLKKLSELCGEYTCEFTGEKRPLLSVQQLQHLKKEWEYSEALLFVGREHPYITHLPDISCYQLDFDPAQPIEHPKRPQITINRFDFDQKIYALAQRRTRQRI